MLKKHILFDCFSLLWRPLNLMLDAFPAVDRDSLLPLIHVANEQGMELSGLVAALARDSSPWRRIRLRRLAKRLHGGATMGDAIELTPRALPLRSLFAIRFGGEMGTLKESLRASHSDADRATQAAIGRIIDAYVYAVTLAVIGGLWLRFSLLKLQPTLRQICMDLELPESAGANRWNRLMNWGEPLSFLYLLLVLGSIWFIGSGSFSRSLQRGWFAWILGIQKSASIADGLEQLAVAKAAGRPPSATIDALARHHHSPMIATQLRLARDRTPDLPSIWTALESVGHLSKPESNALTASEPIGNTAWVLKQFAEKRRRRNGLRLQLISQFAMPAVVILFGGFIVFIATSMLGQVFSIGSFIQ